MVKIRITDRGIITEPGSGFEAGAINVSRNAQNIGYMPYQMAAAQTFTANVSLAAADAGLVILSGTLAPLTATMPSVSTVPGAMYVLRSTSASGHAITGSASDAGVLFVERGESASPMTGSQGQRITMPSIANSSVVLLSDGFRWCVLTGSGSLTYVAP